MCIRDRHRLAVLVDPARHDTQGPAGRVGQPGKGQASLGSVLLLVGEVEVGVDEVPDDAADIEGEDPQRDPALGRRQARARRVEKGVGEDLD